MSGGAHILDQAHAGAPRRMPFDLRPGAIRLGFLAHDGHGQPCLERDGRDQQRRGPLGRSKMIHTRRQQAGDFDSELSEHVGPGEEQELVEVDARAFAR
jgi:hypothetical protein